MKYLILLLLVGCSCYETSKREDKIIALILSANEVGCARLNNVTLDATPYGNFILCTEERYEEIKGE